MKIKERTQNRLAIENKPKVSFGIAIALGTVALLFALYSLVLLGEAPSKDSIFALILGMLFSLGGVLLYTEPTTIFDRKSRKVTWEQRGLVIRKTDTAFFNQIKDVVIGRPVSEQGGGAKRLNLILVDRVLPLMFGFSACNRDTDILEAIKGFINQAKP